MPSPSDLDHQIQARAAALLGGDAEYRRIADEEYGEVQRRWQQDTDTIGRILRAHLFVERFLTENLQRSNPKLGSVEKAKLTFAQKVALLDPQNPEAAAVMPGLRIMNRVRNRLAHESNAAVTSADAAALLDCKAFAQLLGTRHRENLSGLAPISVLEDFARFTGIALSVGHSRLIAAVAQAIRELAPRE
jgi:hypothetical protein